MLKAIRDMFAERFASFDSVRAQCPGMLCGKYAPGDARDHVGKCCPCGIGVVYRLDPGTWYFVGLVWNPLTWRAWEWRSAMGVRKLMAELLDG